jgi:diphosphomevalonate decarboxylase
MHRGHRPDGEDAFAEPLEGANEMNVRMVIAVTSESKKDTLSTAGMARTAESSPYYAAWVASSPADIAEAKRAIKERDLEDLGEITEGSCLAMHASAMAARPAVVYFRGVTLEGYRAIEYLRRMNGVPAWFTCDAGPHIKALTDAQNAQIVADTLARIPGVLRTMICAPGPAARIIE